MNLRLIAAVALSVSSLLAQSTAPVSVIPTASRPAANWQYSRVGDLDGVKAVTKLSDRMLRGAQPDGAAGMESLKKLGVKTILSVEEPDLNETEAAKAAGIAMRNVATEYSGLPKPVIDKLVAAYRDLDGTTYVHCHHGKHRGGAAVAVFRMTFEGFSSDEAISEMFELGCSPRYKGLYETIATYRPDPAVAHRPLAAKDGLANLVEITPRVYRATGTTGDAALKAAKELGVTRIVLVNGDDATAEKVRAAGFDATVFAAPSAFTAVTAGAAKSVLDVTGADKLLVLGSDLASTSAVIAGWRLVRSKWTGEEAAKEVEALVGQDGAALATALRAYVPAK